jgi:hypothetical protein
MCSSWVGASPSRSASVSRVAGESISWLSGWQASPAWVKVSPHQHPAEVHLAGLV